MPTHEWARFHVEVNSNLGPEKQWKEKQEERKKLTNSAKRLVVVRLACFIFGSFSCLFYVLMTSNYEKKAARIYVVQVVTECHLTIKQVTTY